MMTACPSCERSTETWPCACGFMPKLQRELQKPAHQRRWHVEGISKEQFGVSLYDAVFCFGEINGLKLQIQQAIDKGEGYRLQALKRARDLKLEEFTARLGQLRADEVDALVDHFPGSVSP